MAFDDAKHPLLSGLRDPPHQPEQKIGAKKRYRRCKSAPATDILLKKNHAASSPASETIVGKVHPAFIQVIVLLAVYLGIGTTCFCLVKNQIKGKKTNGILDAVYFCIVTMTTVGYGDLVPNSVTTKLLACAFVFTGMALVGLILSKSADYLVEKQEMLLVKALHIHQHVGMTDIMKEIETKRVRYKFLMVTVLLVLLIIVGTVFLSTIEGLNLVDSFYCVCSTITTLGYGDKSFSSEGGRIFAIFWILTSTICVAQFFLYLAELNTEHRQQALVKFVLTRRMTTLDLEAADLDDDGVVSSAEFIIYKLKEMGKISQEDITLVMEEFEDLDVDQSGTLSVSDLTLAQSPPHGSKV
ncbi:two-pore potassium channel 1-like [Magnolia sinica]|uniref:two-pore potassium channel 1-like n=1 Tax=Magnolia sinica TaxID=86752 RepID=UPI00265910AA|nr:two-pore potassium channel 1-like [Magnolia sinica]XP_058080984.1 two-pore potassium channel 1-like [Magnolia sinica]XP_058080986.1 two-pore potassium channel 1-like [Magnolia sinica]